MKNECLIAGQAALAGPMHKGAGVRLGHAGPFLRGPGNLLHHAALPASVRCTPGVFITRGGAIYRPASPRDTFNPPRATRHGLVKTLASVILLALGLNVWAVAGPPNVALIYADDLGYGDRGAYGSMAVQTPNVDRRAREGLRFTSAYSSSATCPRHATRC